MTRAIEMRFPQNEIERSAYAYQKSVENGDIIVVGVNRYKGGETSSASRFSVDPGIEKRHVERLGAFKSRRDGDAVERLLCAIEETARGKNNLLPPIIDAVKGDCTLGEISATLEKVFGRYDPGSMR
jgi:methylmalonyl-CoA mutase N-terminal domain/subunit